MATGKVNWSLGHSIMLSGRLLGRKCSEKTQDTGGDCWRRDPGGCWVAAARVALTPPGHVEAVANVEKNKVGQS